jgi:protein-S-isoprenylcysteine O-methyltransferase Ste14
MQRSLYLAYGVACYLMFLAVYLYFAGFVANWFVPKSIDSGVSGSLAIAVVADVALLLLFGLQHSVMARPAFKRVWTRLVPTPIERSTYMLFSNLALIALMALWQPIDVVIWNVQQPVAWWLLTALFAAGVLLVVVVSLMINHFDLFGLRQVWLHWQGKPYTPLPFRTPLAYACVRHPLYIAWAVFFWAAPTMTLGHLLFAGVLTGYMVLASKIEERDLVEYFGQQYEDYRRRVPAFLPICWPATKPTADAEPEAAA